MFQQESVFHDASGSEVRLASYFHLSCVWEEESLEGCSCAPLRLHPQRKA